MVKNNFAQVVYGKQSSFMYNIAEITWNSLKAGTSSSLVQV